MIDPCENCEEPCYYCDYPCRDKVKYFRWLEKQEKKEHKK